MGTSFADAQVGTVPAVLILRYSGEKFAPATASDRQPLREIRHKWYATQVDVLDGAFVGAVSLRGAAAGINDPSIHVCPVCPCMRTFSTKASLAALAQHDPGNE